LGPSDVRQVWDDHSRHTVHDWTEGMIMKHGLSLAILALFAVACTGPAGVEGSAGATGTQGYAA